jgi:non-heme chloroperoxidase
VTPTAVRLPGAGLELVADRWEVPNPRATVLLLHGGGQTRHSWSRTGERLAATGFTVLSLDARGHGESDWDPSGDYSLDAFSCDLITVVDQLDAPPVLVGASFGGWVSLTAIGEHPGLAAALVLVDVVVDLEPAGVERIQRFMLAHADGFATLEDVAEAVEAYNPLRRRTRNLESLKKNVRQRSDGRWYWHWDPAFVLDGDERRRHDVARLRAAARAVDVPTLLVRGVQSDVVSEAGLEAMVELIPSARRFDVRAAGHMVAGDDNDVFGEALIGFLDEIAGG